MKKRITVEFPDSLSTELLKNKTIVCNTIQYIIGEDTGVYMELRAYPNAPIGMQPPKPYIITPIKRPSRKKS